MQEPCLTFINERTGQRIIRTFSSLPARELQNIVQDRNIEWGEGVDKGFRQIYAARCLQEKDQ